MSIQRHLIILIISIITLASFFAALHGYRASMEQLNRVFDQELISIARILSNATPIKNTNQQEQHFLYQVIKNNQLISKSGIAPENIIDPIEDGFSFVTYNGMRWRAYKLIQNLQTVIVARPVAERVHSAEFVLYKAISPIVLTIPIIALIIFYVIRKYLKPLRNLSKSLQNKEMNELSAITVDQNVEELKPIEQTLNKLFERLHTAFEREQQLATNAAHELRTPISVLNITTHNLIKAHTEREITAEHLQELENNVARMAQVTEQIIALYRFSPDYFNEKLVPLNIEHLLQQVIANNYQSIADEKQTISLESTPLTVIGDEFSLMTLFENLLKNANKYAGQHQEILVTCWQQNNQIMIAIEDSGAGLTQAQIKMMFTRFYRANENKTRVKGSGLGLSIAKHIVELHCGTINGGISALGGLKITVVLPSVASEESNAS